ncbi:hypothetical protein F5887DRAFT_256884 [Amanita rubescens]|nr:hypothetical protein F5887DRAFT_256884 [Amanita rubescens]
MGGVISAIGGVLESIVWGVADLIMAVVDGVICIVATTVDLIIDILCCRCCGGTSRISRTSGRRRWGRRRTAAHTF